MKRTLVAGLCTLAFGAGVLTLQAQATDSHSSPAKVPGVVTTTNMPDGLCHEDDPCFVNPGSTQGDDGIHCQHDTCYCPTDSVCVEWQQLLAPDQDLILGSAP